MAQKIHFPKEVVDRYLEKLAGEIRVTRVLLFGSFAYGKPHKDSDVDIAVISPDFRRMDFWDRAEWLSQQRRGVATSIAMDVIGYTPEEFRKIDRVSLIMREAKKRGKFIFPKP